VCVCVVWLVCQTVVFEFRAKASLGRPDEKQYGFVLEAPVEAVRGLHAGTNTIAVEVRTRCPFVLLIGVWVRTVHSPFVSECMPPRGGLLPCSLAVTACRCTTVAATCPGPTSGST
jgi:hypothetical protein